LLPRSALLAVCCASLAFGATSAQAFPLGVYLGNPNGSDPNDEQAFETSYNSFVADLQRSPRLILTYIDYTQPVSDWPSNASWQAWSNAQSPDAWNLKPVIGFPMASIAGGSPSPDQQFRAFAAGTYDSEIQGVVQAWAQQGFQKLIVRPGWEMNTPGNTYAGNSAQNESDWVAAFQHIHDVLEQAAAANGVTVTVVWNPNVTNYSDVSATGSLYPGNAYVDIIGADMYSDMYPYSDGGSPPTYHDWDTGQEDTSVAQFIADPINRAHYWTYPAATEWSLDSSNGHSQSFVSLLQFAQAQGKPFAVGETGAGNSNAGTDVQDDPTFAQWLAQTLAAYKAGGGRVSFVDIWNDNGGGNYEFSFRSDKKPREAASWQQYFGN
jgi:beta-mannanase